MISSVQVNQDPANFLIANIIPKVGETVGTDDFFCVLLNPLMTSNENEMLTNLIMCKSLDIYGYESEAIYKFIIDCYETLHKLGIGPLLGVKFLTFQFQDEAKQLWRGNVEHISSVLPPLTSK